MARTELRKEWEARVVDFRASGQSASAWCAAHNLKPHQLYYWLKKLEPSKAAATPPSKWVPVEVSEETYATTRNSLYIRIGQATVEVKPGFDPALLSDVVQTLKALC